jgi:RNA polymerase sigma-70 factor (ECF subfamily)
MTDDARFEAAYAAHGASVLRYCLYSVGSSDIAEDLAAETFARFFEHGDHVEADYVEAWLIRVARNLCVSHHRSVARGRGLFARIADAEPVAADGWSDPDAWRYVRRLKEAQRLAIYLRVVEDRSFAEVARALGVTENTAKMTFYRALERVRKEMERDGLGRAVPRLGGAENG